MTELLPRASLSYRVHHNWRWVFELAMDQLQQDYTFNMTSTKGLPSKQFNLPRRYALFQIEWIPNGHSQIQALWITSPLFEEIDAKDQLYAIFNEYRSAMPPTLLLPWDLSDESLIEWNDYPALLKAPLGSGGNSLYFVNSPKDVISIVKSHAHQAASIPQFLDSLRMQYHRIPSWSLQKVVNSIRFHQQKCQFRVYLIALKDQIFAYHQVEVRLPLWDDQPSDSNASVALVFDQKMCQNSTALPYNHKRNKTETKRFVLEELRDLPTDVIQQNIKQLMKDAFSILAQYFQHLYRKYESESSSHTSTLNLRQLAIAGVDIMVDEDCRPYIVELNNNPAMPASSKQMSFAYRSHLIRFVKDIILFGIDGDEHDCFERIS